MESVSAPFMVCFQHRVRPQIAADPVLIQQHSDHPEQDRSSSIRSYIDKEPVSAPFQTVCFQHRVQPHIAADPVLNQQHSVQPEQDRSSNIRSCPLATTPSSSPSRTLSVTVTTPPPRLPPRARPCLLRLAGCSGAPPPAICLCCPCTCSRTTSPFRAARYFQNTAPNGQGAIIVFVSPTFTRVPFGLHHPVSHLQSVEAGPRVLVSSTDVSPTLRPVDRPLKVHQPFRPCPILALCNWIHARLDFAPILLRLQSLGAHATPTQPGVVLRRLPSCTSAWHGWQVVRAPHHARHHQVV